MKKTVFTLLLLPLLILAGCSKDNNPTLVDVALTVSLPANEVPEPVTPGTKASAGDPAVGFDVVFTNTATQSQTKVKTDAQGVAKAKVEEGIYNVAVSGTYEANGKETLYQYNLTSQSIMMPIEGSGVVLPPVIPEIATVSGGWVIKEVYNSGCRTDAGKAYMYDQYITLYNNSNEVLYADSLIIAMSSKFTNDNMDQSYLGNLLPGKVVPDLLIQVPGTGKQHPVQPGKCLVVANQGLNHTEASGGSSKADLSKADFEWYDDHALDVDVPEVPNMINLYGYSKTINTFSVQSNRAYFILRPTGDITAFMNSLKTTIVLPSGTSKEMYPIPTEMIIDGVQLAPNGSALNNPSLPSSVDAGYTYVGANAGESGSYSGLCVSRKVKEKAADGRYILQDTNNSSNDFRPNQELSPYAVKE